MSAQQVCLGWHWYPYRYATTAEDGDGAPVKPFPAWLNDLAGRTVDAAYGPGSATETYDIAIINFYDSTARMGMHRDQDEKSLAPVVSFSLGDSCTFRFGNTEKRTRPYTDVELHSGDAFVFGGPARLAYHGVPKVKPGTAPSGLDLPGRVNITLRVSGFG